MLVEGDIIKRLILAILFSLFLCLQAQAGDLVGYWNMDEASGNLTDLSGHGTTCIAQGTPTYQVSSVEINRGKAIQLDNSGDYFNCGNNSIYDFTTAFTLMIWIYPTMSNPASINQWYLLSHHSYPNAGWWLFLRGPTRRISFFTEDGTIHGPEPSSPLWVTNRWHFIAATSNGTTNTLYLDGVLIGSVASGTLTSVSTSLFISSGISGRFEGLLDDIKIYNYALSAIQIQHEYQQSRLAIFRKHEPWKWTDLLNLAFIMKGDQIYEKDNRISFLRQHPVN